MTVKYIINYGGYVGCDDEYEVDVPDDATQFDIEKAIAEDFEQQVLDNCSWEIEEADTDD